MLTILHVLNFYGFSAVDCYIKFHCDNFAIVKRLRKFFIKDEAIKPLRAIVIKSLRAIVMKLVLLDICAEFI